MSLSNIESLGDSSNTFDTSSPSSTKLASETRDKDTKTLDSVATDKKSEETVLDGETDQGIVNGGLTMDIDDIEWNQFQSAPSVAEYLAESDDVCCDSTAVTISDPSSPPSPVFEDRNENKVLNSGSLNDHNSEVNCSTSPRDVRNDKVHSNSSTSDLKVISSDSPLEGDNVTNDDPEVVSDTPLDDSQNAMLPEEESS